MRPVPILRRRPARVPLAVAGALAFVAIGLTSTASTGASVGRSAARVDASTVAAPARSGAVASSSSKAAADPGRIAYVTPAGDVVVADADGSNSVVVGHNAVANSHGLAPIAWRQPAADAITYVDKDRHLVVAPVDGSAPRFLADDAVVPPYADEDILSWDLTGSFVVYLAEPTPGQIEPRVVDLTNASADSTQEPPSRAIGNPERRIVIAQQFSPLDPIIFQKTADVDTGAEYTVAIVEPFSGTIYGSTFSIDDVTFTPDGRYAFGVSSGSGSVEQLVRLSMRKPTGLDLVSDHDRVCRPAVSPDAKRVVFAAGKDCQEIWTININGTDPKRIAAKVGARSTFDVGAFSWSTDGATITHAACEHVAATDAVSGSSSTDDPRSTTQCGGGYWDIPADGGKPTARATAGSVLREQRSLLRPVKVRIDITGPIKYSGTIQPSGQSTGVPFANTPDEKVQVKGVDENDAGRSFELKAVHPVNSLWIAGTLRIVDSGFDETFPFFGRVLPFSLGYAKMRGIWTRSESIPFQSGQIVVTVER